jgi:hypothetical protein
MNKHRHLTRGAFFIPIFKEETMRRLKDLFYSRDKPKNYLDKINHQKISQSRRSRWHWLIFFCAKLLYP